MKGFEGMSDNSQLDFMNNRTSFDQIIKGLLLISYLSISSPLINLVQMMTIPLALLSMTHLKKANNFLAKVYWSSLVIIMKRIYKMEIEIDGDSLPEKEVVFVESNHQSIVDIPVLMVLAYKQKSLAGLKFFVKDIIKYLPGPGWGMLFLDCIFVKRTWSKDASTINRVFQRLLSTKQPFWLVSFVEGTRITRKKRDSSQKYASKNELPLLSRVLQPRTKGFTASLTGLHHTIDAVYSVTIYYPQGIPGLWQLASGSVKHIKVNVKRIPMSRFPSSDQERKEWLIQRYVEKDEIMRKLSKAH